MSISGERTQEIHRRQIAETAKALEDTRIKLQKNIEELNGKLNQIDIKLEKAVSNTDKLMNFKPVKSQNPQTEDEKYEESPFGQ